MYCLKLDLETAHYVNFIKQFIENKKLFLKQKKINFDYSTLIIKHDKIEFTKRVLMTSEIFDLREQP